MNREKKDIHQLFLIYRLLIFCIISITLCQKTKSFVINYNESQVDGNDCTFFYFLIIFSFKIATESPFNPSAFVIDDDDDDENEELSTVDLFKYDTTTSTDAENETSTVDPFEYETTTVIDDNENKTTFSTGLDEEEEVPMKIPTLIEEFQTFVEDTIIGNDRSSTSKNEDKQKEDDDDEDTRSSSDNSDEEQDKSRDHKHSPSGEENWEEAQGDEDANKDEPDDDD